MQLSTLILTVLLVLGLGACAKKSPEHAKVKIQFDPAIFQNASVSGSVAGTSSSPNWGLTDPAGLSDIDCWAVFVGGPENFMHGNHCKNPAGEFVAKFGPRAGFFRIDEAGEILVPPGGDRQFWLAAMSSSDGTCDSGFDYDPNIDFSKYSAPFIIGFAQKEISGNSAVVDIQVQNTFTAANKIQDCDFIQGGSGNNGLTLSPYESQRPFWIDDNPIPRTVSVAHNGVSLDCKVGTGTWGPCATNFSFVWEIADRASPHIIRVTYADGTSEQTSWVPDTEFGTVNFLSCTDNITSAENTLALLNPKTSQTGQTICIDNGYSFSFGDGSGLSFGENSRLVVRHGETAEISNTAGSVLTFSSAVNSYAEIFGLKIQGAGNSMSALSFTNTDATNSINVAIIDSEIVRTGTNGNGLYAYSAGGPLNISLVDSTVLANGGDTGVHATAQNVDISIENSIVESNYKAIYAYNGMIDVNNGSVVKSTGASTAALHSELDGIINVQDSKVYTEGSIAVLNCGLSTPTAVLDISGSTFIRKSGVGTTGPAITSVGTGCANVIIDISTDNLFCHQDPAGAISFSPVLSQTLAIDGSSTFDPANYSVNDCPSGI